jgi:hypothetical protein
VTVSGDRETSPVTMKAQAPKTANARLCRFARSNSWFANTSTNIRFQQKIQMVETAMSNKVHKLPSFYKHNQIKLHSETELPIIELLLSDQP